MSKGKKHNHMYITQSEWIRDFGGKESRIEYKPTRVLPFYCCALSLQPFEDPMCAPDGSVFDILNIIPWIKKFKIHPVTGEPLAMKDLFALKFHKNTSGEYHCPITFKVFTEHTHIVAIRTTGNVYSFEAVDEMNIKLKNWKDLLTEEPFTRKDIITIQDPYNMAKRDANEFVHMKREMKLETEEEKIAKSSGSYYVNTNLSTARVLKKLPTESESSDSSAQQSSTSTSSLISSEINSILQRADEVRKQEEEERKQREKEKAKKNKYKKQYKDNYLLINQLHTHGKFSEMKQLEQEVHDRYKPQPPKKEPETKKSDSTPAEPMTNSSGGKILYRSEPARGREATMSASFTSTAVNVRYKREVHEPTAEEKRQKVYDRVKKMQKKGYARITTNMGDLNLEIYCDTTPKAADNFLSLCENGYYDNTIFHRLIRNFVLQGGDPTGTGKGGESVWGKPFKDEIFAKLSHSGTGVLSMANSGINSNGSQFFITLKSCTHLDGKHTIFGRVVGGLDNLKQMERVPTDEKDRPLDEIRIINTTVFVNPFAEIDIDEEERKEREEAERKKKEAEEGEIRGEWYSNPGALATQNLKVVRQGVGKYLSAIGTSTDATTTTAAAAAAQPESTTTGAKRPLAETAPVEKPTGKAPKTARTEFNFDNW